MTKSVLLILVCGFACSQSKKHTVSYVGTNLEIDKNNEKHAPSLVSGASSENYGPLNKSGIATSEKSEKRPSVVGFILGPGIYRTLALIPILKSFKLNEVPLHFIGGHGLASIIASYYALGVKPDLIEWKIHKFLVKNKELRPYSSKWIEAWKKYLKKDFLNIRIEHAKLNLFLPLYNKRKKKVEYITRGNLYKNLIEGLELVGSLKRYSAAFLHEVSNPQPLKKMGVDYFGVINVLGGSINWQRSNDFLIGAFGKTSSRLKKASENIDGYYEIDLSEIEIDSVEKISEVIRIGRKSAEKISQKFLLELESIE